MIRNFYHFGIRIITSKLYSFYHRIIMTLKIFILQRRFALASLLICLLIEPLVAHSETNNNNNNNNNNDEKPLSVLLQERNSNPQLTDSQPAQEGRDSNEIRVHQHLQDDLINHHQLGEMSSDDPHSQSKHQEQQQSSLVNNNGQQQETTIPNYSKKFAELKLPTDLVQQFTTGNNNNQQTNENSHHHQAPPPSSSAITNQRQPQQQLNNQDHSITQSTIAPNQQQQVIEQQTMKSNIIINNNKPNNFGLPPSRGIISLINGESSAAAASNSQQQATTSQQQQRQQQQQVALNYPTQPQPHISSVGGNYPTQQQTVAQQHHHQHQQQLYFGHNPFIEILKPLSYADDNIVTLNLSHSHIYEIDSEAFVGQRFEHIDLSNNKLGLIHSRSFRIGPNHSKHNLHTGNSSKQLLLGNSGNPYPTRRPPPSNPKSVTIDFSHNPAIVALSGAFDHIDVPNCLLNFTNSTVELKFGAFKKYLKEHPGHIIEIDTVDCCEQEWLLGYKHNFVSRTYCDHDPSLFLLKASQQTIIDSCIAYVTSARHTMTMPGPSIIHPAPRHHSNAHTDNQFTTYLILGGTAMVLTSLSIYIIIYMFSLKAAFVCQMQHKS